MRVFRMVAAAVCAVALGGCVASEADFNADVKAMTDPAVFKSKLDECIAIVLNNPVELNTRMLLTGLPPEGAAKLSCERLLKAMVAGRYNYSNYVNVTSRGADPDVIRMIQGR